MFEIRQTEAFQDWLASLRDQRARVKVAIRISRLQSGLIGDAKFFGGIGELRINHGPGYRVYFTRRGNVVIILLCGGDKSSQQRDIAHAKTMASEV